MSQESSSDFSIVKRYVELQTKFDAEIKNFSEKNRAIEEKYKKHVAALEAEVTKRNEHIKSQDARLQELTQKMAEKDEQLKTIGLQLHRLKAQSSGPAPSQQENARKKGFFK